MRRSSSWRRTRDSCEEAFRGPFFLSGFNGSEEARVRRKLGRNSHRTAVCCPAYQSLQHAEECT